MECLRRSIAWCLSAASLWLTLAICTLAPASIAAQDGVPRAEQYGGEAQIESAPPVPVHLEIRRSEYGVEGTISAQNARFSLEEARGSDVVTATLGGPGGGSITLRFTGDRVDGEFKVGGQSGKLEAIRTFMDADEFFRPPTQRLDLSPAEWRTDLARLAELLTTRHGSPFHRTSRQTFEREVERVRAALPQMSGPQTALEFRKLAALVGDGHTSVAAAENRLFYQLEMFWFDDGIRVVGAAAEHADMLGAKLTRVAGVPVDEVIHRLRPYAAQGESDWYYRSLAPYLIAEMDILDNARIGTGATRTFTFERTDGSSQQIELTASNEGKSQAVLGVKKPLWLREPGDPFAVKRLVDGTMYINWRSYDDLAERGQLLAGEIDRVRPLRVIVDLRDNGGGDFNVGREFVRLLAAKPWLDRSDRLFVLIGRKTFSAAMTNAVDFAKMSNATLIGEPPGAAPNNWQEVRFFHLPNSGLRVGVSTLYYEFIPGELAVQPDILIPPTPTDWGSEHDAAVRYVLALPPPPTER